MHVPPLHLCRRVERVAVGDRRIHRRQDHDVALLSHEIPKVELRYCHTSQVMKYQK